MLYPYYHIQKENTTSGFRPNLIYLYNMLDTNVYKFDSITLENTMMESDFSWLFTNKIEEYIFSVENFKVDSIYRTFVKENYDFKSALIDTHIFINQNYVKI